jgi:DnaJ like chaperone protein
MSEERFERIGAPRHVSIGRDPYKVLGVSPSRMISRPSAAATTASSTSIIPIVSISRGVPEEFHVDCQ